MGKRWKTIVGLAMLGFAITAGFYILGVYHDYAKPSGFLDTILAFANVILCPPILLFVWCIDCEYGTAAGLEVNLVIVGLINAALYVVIGLAISRWREGKVSKNWPDDRVGTSLDSTAGKSGNRKLTRPQN
jgi:hypothetical protein